MFPIKIDEYNVMFVARHDVRIKNFFRKNIEFILKNKIKLYYTWIDQNNHYQRTYILSNHITFYECDPTIFYSTKYAVYIEFKNEKQYAKYKLKFEL